MITAYDQDLLPVVAQDLSDKPDGDEDGDSVGLNEVEGEVAEEDEEEDEEAA